MSASLWIETDEQHVSLCNMTYNLTPMLAAAGLPAWRCFTGMEARAAWPIFRRVRDTLTADPDRFKEFNPRNGWGDYAGAVKQLGYMVDRCKEHPTGLLGTWL